MIPIIRAALPCCSIAILLAIAPARAQTIVGTITESGGRAPITLVDVTLRDVNGATAGSTTTDSLGIFRIQAPSPGRYTLFLNRLGYSSQTTETFEVARGEVVTFDISMSTEVVVLEPLKIVERRRDAVPRLAQFYERAVSNRRLGWGRVYFKEDLEMVGSLRTLHLMNPGRANCRMEVLIDGMPVMDTADLDAIAQLNIVEGVEIYRSRNQVPPEFAPFTSCGLMLVWTRPQPTRPFSFLRLVVASAVVGVLYLIGKM